MAKTKFLRRTWSRYSKLGKKKKKKQVWKKPRGRDNKMREKRRGYSPVVSIGYKKEKRKNIFIIRNLKDFEKAPKGSISVMGKIGRKKKIEIAKKSKETGIKIRGFNLEKILEKEKIKNGNSREGSAK